MLSEDGQHLVVKDINNDHNHIVNNATFIHLPRQRQLDNESKKEAALLLGLKANKKMVQEHLQVVRAVTFLFQLITSMYLCVDTAVRAMFPPPLVLATLVSRCIRIIAVLQSSGQVNNGLSYQL